MLKTYETYRKILEMLDTKLYSKADIARQLGIGRKTVFQCQKRYKNLDDLLSKIDSNGKIMLPKQQTNLNLLEKLKTNSLNKDLQKNYSYLLGIVLGDGCLTRHTKTKSCFRLQISCDVKYPKIIDRIKTSMQKLMPLNKMNELLHLNDNNMPSWIDVYCYSTEWNLFFPFFKEGKKHTYSIVLEPWQKQIIESYPKEFITGLIQTDGWRIITNDKYKYVRYKFSQVSNDIFDLFLWCCELLQISPTIYKRINSGYAKQKSIINIATLAKEKDTKFLDEFIGSKQ